MPGRLHLLAALLLLSFAAPVASPQPAPACLDVLDAKVATDGALQLSWTRMGGATGYEVRARYPTEPWTVLVRWLPPDTTTFALRPSVVGREYQVLALREGGSGTATCPVMAVAPASAGPILSQAAAQAGPLVGVGLLGAAVVLVVRHWSANRAAPKPPMTPVAFERVRAEAAAKAPLSAPMPEPAPRAIAPARTPPRRASPRGAKAPTSPTARKRKPVSRSSGNR